ncbi:MAG: substrate-binding domain-containing protein [Treponema sp.]|nr:substrate-binding domain-containing protein [Treponema sp.]
MFTGFVFAVLVLFTAAGCTRNENAGRQISTGGGEGIIAGGDNSRFTEVAIGPVAGKTDRDYQFAFSFGGVNPYADPVPGAANDMAKILQIPDIIEQTPQHWEQNEQNVILDAFIAQNIRGIFMMPSNATAANAEITKIVKAGVPVVCMGGPPDDPTDALLTLATDVYQSAYDGTMAIIEKTGQKGNIVALSGQISDPNTKARFQASVDACAKYPDVNLIQQIGDIDDAELSVTAVENLLAAQGDKINGIISTAYYPSVAIATYLADPKYSHIIGVGIDTDEKVLDAIRSGSIYGTMSQNPYGQGYICTLTLKMLADGWTYKSTESKHIDSGSFLITKDNINDLDNLKIDVTNRILSTWVARFNPPAN